MNQNDYKKIAELIKKNINKKTGTGWIYTGSLLNNLADYFEEEDRICPRCNKRMTKQLGTEFICKCYKVPISKHKDFNREQFFQDCGVSE